jgi:hypothetical protein
MANLPVTERGKVTRSAVCTYEYRKKRIRAKIQYSASFGGWIGKVTGQGTHTFHTDTLGTGCVECCLYGDKHLGLIKPRNFDWLNKISLICDDSVTTKNL